MHYGPATCKNEESEPHRWPRSFYSSEFRSSTYKKRNALSLSLFQFPTINPSTRSKGERGHEDGAPPPQLLHFPSPFLSSPNGRLSHPPSWVPHLRSFFFYAVNRFDFLLLLFFLWSNSLVWIVSPFNILYAIYVRFFFPRFLFVGDLWGENPAMDGIVRFRF